jgi:hypothetical protein
MPSFRQEDVEDDGEAEELHEVGEEELEYGPEDSRRHEDVDPHARHPRQPVHKLVAAEHNTSFKLQSAGYQQGSSEY